MASTSSSPTPPPKLIISVLILAGSIAAALVFATAFAEAPNPPLDPTLCGNPAPLDQAPRDDHDHGSKAEKADPIYFVGGICSPKYGLAPMLDTAMLAIANKQRPIIYQSAVTIGEDLIIIDRSPIALKPIANSDTKPTLVLSIDYTGGISSMEYPGGAALQKYITDEKDKYQSILIVEPLPGPVRDPDEDWTYLNFAGDEKIDFLTPRRKASPGEVVLAVIAAIGGSDNTTSDVVSLVEQLGSDKAADAASARMKLITMSPYEVVPYLNTWLAEGGEGERREHRLYEALMVRRGLGVHADALLAEAANSENPQLRALAARAIADLAGVTTDPFGLLTPLAEDNEMAVRYEALVATRAMPGRRAAGIAQLVEPYEMTDAMRSAYRGTLGELLAFGEPVQADSRANRLRRMAMSELLKAERDALVCAILLERSDLPDENIDEVLGQLASFNGQGSLTVLLNLLETMNPSTLAKREVLLDKLIEWKPNELNAQTPRLKEMALGNGSENVRRAAAAAIAMSSEPSVALMELDNKPIAYESLGRVNDTDVLKRWAVPVIEQVKKATPTDTTIAAVDAVPLLPTDSLTIENGTMLLGLANNAGSIDLRFAAIRTLNALPAGIQPTGTEDLTLTSLTITAVAGMKYDKATLTVPAARPVEITLFNPDTMEHNLVITKPGRAQEIGVAMSADPTAAAAVGYVPKDSDAVLFYTGMLKPGESETLRFFAPTTAGSYEFVCTYPGHWGSMRGVLEVVAP
ncbi:MAG: plastocyanin/azurin family copper-binding protein [Planctomycetota bacterium]